MVKGIGVDTADISQVVRLMKMKDDAFVLRTFTSKEVECSLHTADQAAYLAARFAAKEAVFKAIAHLTKLKSFDFRMVETLNAEDGSPFVYINSRLSELLAEAGIDEILISLTTENNLATAFVIAQSKGRFKVCVNSKS